MIRLIRTLFLISVSFFLAACASRPPVVELPQKKADVLVLGGSVTGLAAASALLDFDKNITVLLAEEQEYFVTVPYVGLYLLDKIDKKLVIDGYETIANNKGYAWINRPLIRIDAAKKQVYFDTIVVNYNVLLDARYAEEGSSDTSLNQTLERMERIREDLKRQQTKKVLIDARGATEGEAREAVELFHLISVVMSERKECEVMLRLDQESPFASEISYSPDGREPDLLITFPGLSTEGRIDPFGNFFAQYNDGLERASAIMRDNFGGTFLPSTVGEEEVIIEEPVRLKAIDVKNKAPLNGSDYLAKVIKIKYEIMQGR